MMTRAFLLQTCRQPTWMAHTEFTLRPRFARTGVVGHDGLFLGPITKLLSERKRDIRTPRPRFAVMAGAGADYHILLAAHHISQR